MVVDMTDKGRLAEIRKRGENGVYYTGGDRDDVNFLLAEVDHLQAEVEELVWNLAGCETFALGYQLDMEPHKDMARPALLTVREQIKKFTTQLDRQREVLEKARDAIKNCRVIFNDIKNEHMDCAEGNVDDEHAMFHHAERGNKFCHDTLTTITDVLGEEDKR